MVMVKKEKLTDFVNMETNTHETNGCHEDGV